MAMRERDNRLIQVAELNRDVFKINDIARRVYSPDGIAPTIHTCGGGNTEPKIIVAATLPGYEKSGRIYDPDGISPTIEARDWKGAKKVIVWVRD
jgi:DNA (cytosine-5)-methyltransferase 1